MASKESGLLDVLAHNPKSDLLARLGRLIAMKVGTRALVGATAGISVALGLFGCSVVGPATVKEAGEVLECQSLVPETDLGMLANVFSEVASCATPDGHALTIAKTTGEGDPKGLVTELGGWYVVLSDGDGLAAVTDDKKTAGYITDRIDGAKSYAPVGEPADPIESPVGEETPEAETTPGEVDCDSPDLSQEEYVEADCGDVQEQAPDLYEVGEVVSLGDWEVTVTDIDFNAADQIAEANQFNDEASGRYVLATYEATYHGDERTADLYALSWSFTTTDQEVHQPASVVTPMENTDEPTSVRKGGTLKAEVVFDLDPKLVDGGLLSVESYTDIDSVYADINITKS